MPELYVSDHVDIQDLRARIRKMTDAEVLRFGKDNRYMCSPYVNQGKPPLEAFLIQLHEARAEWRRRHPETYSVQCCAVSGGSQFVDLRYSAT